MSLMHTALIRRYPELAGVPGPTPRFPLGNLQDFAHGQPWRTSLDYAERYGPFALFWILNQPAIFVHEPEAIADILERKREYFIKSEPTDAMRPGATDSAMFVANGADWAIKRRTDFLADAREQTREWMAERFGPAVAYLRNKLVQAPWGGGGGRITNFEQPLYRLVFDVQSFLSFGRRMSDRDFRRYNHVMDVIDLRMKTNLPLLSPQFHRVLRKWHEAVAEAIDANAEQPEGRSLSHVLARHSVLPRKHLVSEMSNVFSGGVFSMTVAIAHALGCLSAHGRELRRVREELAGLGPDPSYAELCQSEALEGAVRESVRLYAPAPVFLRTVKAQSVQVGPLRLREGVRVAVGMLPLHRDEGHWEHAREFIPTRWTSQVRAANPYGSGHFFPFGRGPRTCGGQALALFVIRSVLYALLSDPTRELDVSMPASHRYYFGCMMPQGMAARVGS